MSSFNDLLSELAELVKRKEGVKASLAEVERKIYNYEGSYLEDYQEFGNIVHGWNTLATSNVPDRNTQDRRHSIPINDTDRIFSNSSVTSNAVINSIREAEGTLDSETETACSSDGNMTDTDFEIMHGLTNGLVTIRNLPAAIERSSGRKKNPSKPKKQQNH